jgi:hypothetical protein
VVSSWLQIQRSRVRFPALPDFLRRSGFGTESTQPRGDNRGGTWKKISGSGLENQKLMAVGIFLLWKKYSKYKKGLGNAHPSCSRVSLLRWPRDTLYPLKLALTSPTSGGRSVGIHVVHWRTKAPEYLLCVITLYVKVKYWKGGEGTLPNYPVNSMLVCSHTLRYLWYNVR